MADDLSKFAGTDVGERGAGPMDGGWETGDKGEMSEGWGEKPREEKVLDESQKDQQSKPKSEDREGEKPDEISKPLVMVLQELQIDERQNPDLVKAIKDDLQQHLELLRKEDVRQEMLKLVLAHIWKEMIELMGAKELIPELENEQIVKNLKERYQKKVLVAEEERLLGQMRQEAILPVVMGRMMRYAVAVDGGQTDYVSWRKVMMAYRENVDAKKLDKLNKRMRWLMGAMKEIDAQPDRPDQTLPKNETATKTEEN